MKDNKKEVMKWIDDKKKCKRKRGKKEEKHGKKKKFSMNKR